MIDAVQLWRLNDALAYALNAWRVQLIGVVTPNQYQQLVRRHVAIVNDPGSTE